MKSNEFIDEGLWDTVKSGAKKLGGMAKHEFAKKGWLGGAAQQSAYITQHEKEQGAMQQAQEKQKLANWLKMLPVQITKAMQAGEVTLTESEFNYEKFNQLIEGKINQNLSEAMNLAAFLKNYLEKISQSKGVQITPDMETNLANHINTFVSNFADPGADIAPEKVKLSPEAIKAATSMWNALSTATLTQKPSLGSTFGAPKTNMTVDVQGTDYTYDIATKQWSDGTNVINNPTDIQMLNKLAYDQAKTAPKSYPEPTGPVPADAASGKTWKPTGARNNYTFDPTDKKWRLGTLSSTKIITDPAVINALNKAYAEQGAL
jgi:hypothetical protein